VPSSDGVCADLPAARWLAPSVSGLVLKTDSRSLIGPSTVYYRLLDARTGRRSTALATNIDFKAWADYLGDPPLATAFID